ncbi:MAG: hypothetical protein M3T49_08460 [Candidatus Eremiobacteraeota bacterium]|nr:hypothetical protein [Candidatus Eremiobacteraeota bacterium]
MTRIGLLGGLALALFSASAIAPAHKLSTSDGPALASRMVLTPPAAKTFSEHAVQFRASVFDAARPARIRWSVVGAGRIGPDGLYRAARSGGAQVIAAADGVARAADIALSAVPPPDRPLLLVSCYDGGTIDVLDAASLNQAGEFSIGAVASGIAVNPRRRAALVAAGDRVVAIDLRSMDWQASAPLPRARYSEVAALAGGYFAVTDNNASAGNTGVRFFSIGAAGRPLPAGGAAAGETPEGIAADSNGRRFYVSNINSSTVMAFGFDGRGHARRIATALTGARPFGLTKAEARETLFVADNDTPTVSGSRARPGLEAFALPSLRRIGAVRRTGSRDALPLGLAVDERSGRIFVTNEGDGTVAVFSLHGPNLIATLRSGGLPWLPAIDARHHRLYVPNAGDDAVQEFDTVSLRHVASAQPTCGYPTALTLVQASPPVGPNPRHAHAGALGAK